ncbi:hypothetical protein SDC9_182648 [bioreactor metagenome]|uniref:Uncharacterized protein n=1 Tax=bioreactor metagenome TaxID=1076179 RepID=A0A645HHL1_9ZZZZ
MLYGLEIMSGSIPTCSLSRIFAKLIIKSLDTSALISNFLISSLAVMITCPNAICSFNEESTKRNVSGQIDIGNKKVDVKDTFFSVFLPRYRLKLSSSSAHSLTNFWNICGPTTSVTSGILPKSRILKSLFRNVFEAG